MKKKAGQASGPSRSSEVRSTALVPVNNSNKQLKASVPDAPKAVSAKAPARTPAASPKSSSGKPSAAKSATSSKSASSSSSVRNTAETAKNTAKRVSKKKKSAAPVVLGVILGVLLIAGGVFAYLYYTGFFKPTIEVTMADGTIQKVKVEEVYAELMTDKFFQGTIIDGIEVGGMTTDEAFNAVSATLPDKPLNIDVKLNLEGKTLKLDFSDAEFEYNTREVVDKAFSNFRPLNDTDLVQLKECYNGMQQLKNTPQQYETAYTVQIDGVSEKVHKVLDPLLDEYATTKDAYIEEFDVETREFKIVPEVVGYVIDVDGTALAVKDLFDSKVYTGNIKVPTTPQVPEVTEEMIKAEFGLVGEMTTKCSSNSNRNNNINQACKYIDGTILEPGAKFSFNETVGQRTSARGFKEATVILGGQYEQGLGGGICQVSSTLYNAVAKSDLKVIERNNHAWPSDYVLVGCDATVDWPALDFKFENDTEFQVIISMWFDSSDNTVHAEIYGKKLPDEQYIKLESQIISTTSAGANEYVEDKTMPAGQQKTIRAAHQGQTARIYKVWFDKDGNEVKREEYYTTSYKAYGTRIAVGTLNADGTYAALDKSTGKVNTPSPTPEPTTDPNVTPTTAPVTVTETPTVPPTDTPAPPTDTPAPEQQEGDNSNNNGGST